MNIEEFYRASLLAQMVKNPPAMWETWSGSLDYENPLEDRIGIPLQYSCLENPMGGGAWWVIHGLQRVRQD